MLELGGARQDATALWALFTDTLQDLSGRLLVDEMATYTDVSQALLGTLSSALPDDVVVVTFAVRGDAVYMAVDQKPKSGTARTVALRIRGIPRPNTCTPSAVARRMATER